MILRLIKSVFFMLALLLCLAKFGFCQAVASTGDFQSYQNPHTVAAILAAINEPDAHKRQEAAQYLYALRNHYMVSALGSVSSSRPQNETLLTSLEVLSLLRPSDPHVASVMKSRLTFEASSLLGPSLSPPLPYYPAADVIERMSLPALPSLAYSIAKVPTPQMNNLSIIDNIYLFRSLAILGPALEDWLTDNAKAVISIDAQTRFKKAALFVSRHTSETGTRSYGTISSIEGGAALEGGFDDGWFQSLLPENIQLRWDLTDPLLKASSSPSSLTVNDSNTHATSISQEISLTLGLSEYLLVRQLEGTNQLPLRKTAQPVYSDAVQVDAIRLLGALRCDYAPWAIWAHLEKRSEAVLIDKDNSEQTKVCLRALCQIDIPAVKMLVEKIPTELGVEQRRAATYTLSRIMGRYSVPYIEREISILKEPSTGDGDNKKSLSRQYQEQAQRLKEMLELGKEKGWFTGDYYGANDPHAYDLVFDDTPAPANTPQP